MRRTIATVLVGVGIVLAFWLVLYLALGVGSDSGPTVTTINRG